MEPRQSSYRTEDAVSTLDRSMQATLLRLLDSDAEVTSESASAQIEEWREMLAEIADEARAVRFEFASYLAHELRTPMTSIRGYADLLKGGIAGPLSDQQTTFLETIADNVDRMQTLVSDLYDISRIESGRIHLDLGPTPLKEAVSRALAPIQRQITARNQQVTLDISDDLPELHVDPARLEQVLTDLLSNASKYTSDGGSIKVTAARQVNTIRCAVADTGIGISAQDQERLFTKFFRSQDPAVRSQHGTGLGLCIVKSLVELHGGSTTVSSRLGEGTTVTFTLPILHDS